MTIAEQRGWYVPRDGIPTIDTDANSDKIYAIKLSGDGFKTPITAAALVGTDSAVDVLPFGDDTISWRYAGAGGLVTFRYTFGPDDEIDDITIRHLPRS